MLRSARVPMYELNILTQIFHTRTNYFLEYLIFKFLMSIGIASTNAIVNSRSFDDFQFSKKILGVFEPSPTLRAVGFSYVKRERNHGKQPFVPFN